MLKINSNSKTLIKSVVILILFFGALKSWATWVAPTQGPIGGNTPSPIHVGSDLQSKSGGIIVGGLRVFGPTSVALFDGQVEIQGGNPGAGKVLTSDVNGLATWQPSASGGDSLWVRTGNLLSPLNPNDDVGVSGSAVIYKNNSRFIHTTGVNNVFMGTNAGNFSTSGTGQNTTLGNNTLIANTTGNQNTAIEFKALEDNTTGAGNTAIGWLALSNNTTGGLSGGGNTSLGISSLFSNTTGNQNVGIGQGALYNNITGSQNTAIGTSADVGSGNLTNATAIGFSASVTESNSMVFGNGSVTKNTFNGGIIVNSNNTSKPTCNSVVRGMLWFTHGANNVKDSLEVCAKDASNSYAWRVIY